MSAVIPQARVDHEFPRRVREVEHMWVPMADGTRLAARMWIPEDADNNPVPVILEYIPYRKKDGTAYRDERMHQWFAGQGYAAVRLDMRGSGESDGVYYDEYLQQEQDDGVEAIAWLASQPWSTGAVGMIGKSWSGFNGLQVAFHQPPALKAVITLFSVTDRYNEDIHYKNGCMVKENVGWGSYMHLLVQPPPPDPRLYGEGWKEAWIKRLEAIDPLVGIWLENHHRTEYWKHGSVCEDYSRIKAAVYAIGGWPDGYANAIPQLLEGLSSPVKGLVGPWGHQYPMDGFPGPQIGFLQECIRFFDCHLKGIDNGIMDEPVYRAWEQEKLDGSFWRLETPGRWIAEETWPSPRIPGEAWQLSGDRRLLPPGANAGGDAVLPCRTPVAMGNSRHQWGHMGRAEQWEHPADQSGEDALSLTFDSAVLDAPLSIFGAPVLTLNVASDKPVAHLYARISEVYPDGRSIPVTYGARNLGLSDDCSQERRLTPGQPVKVTIQLNHWAHRFQPGSRIRLSLSTSLWPLFWPAPEWATLSVDTAGATLTLPVRPDRPEDADLRPFEEPVVSPTLARTMVREGKPPALHYVHDVKGKVTFHEFFDEGRTRLDRDGWEDSAWLRQETSVTEGDPLSARQFVEGGTEFGRGDEIQAKSYGTMTVTCDKENFYMKATLEVSDRDKPIFARSWLRTIPRRGL